MLRSVRNKVGAAAIVVGAFFGGVMAHAQGLQVANLAAIGKLDYDVLRDGDKIGDHAFVFSRDGDALNVQIDTDVKVKLAFVTLYKFWHHATEKWLDGHLVALASKTDDDGTDHEMNVTAKDDKLAVLADKKATVEPLDSMPASLWNLGIVKVPVTLNTLDGSMMAIKTELVGEEDVKGPNGPVHSRHYSITGDLQRELWFDPQGTLVKVRFKGQDGSDIQYVLK